MLNEGSGAMEKQPIRQLQGASKNNGAVDRRNDFTPNRNARPRKWKDSGSRSQDPPVPAASRSAPKWTKPNGDKRPRSRGFTGEKQKEEIAEDDDTLPGEFPYASHSRKGNGNHLLSFQYERRGAHQNTWSYRRPTPRSKYSYKQAQRNMEQFLQASYQFVVLESAQHLVQDTDPDVLVDWNLVELVRSHTSEEVTCSICLMPFMAGKMTKCGHTYCWACILHFLSIDESERHGCPLCHQPIAVEELRSIRHITVPHYAEQQVIEMKLMRKNKGALFVCPKAQWEDREGKPLNVHDGDATAFNKVLVATSKQIYSDVIETEKAHLEIQLIDAQDYEHGYIGMARDLLTKRETDLLAQICTVGESRATREENQTEMRPEAEATVEKPALPPDISFDGSKIMTAYTDAFEDEADSGLPPSPTRKSQSDVSEESEIPPDSGNTPRSLEDGTAEPNKSKDEDDIGKPRNDSLSDEVIPFSTMHNEGFSENVSGFDEGLSEGLEVEEQQTKSKDCIEVPEGTISASEAADHLELPPESTGEPQARRANQTKDVFYFYQASTGQHIYLNSLNVQCLVKEYGSLDNSPDTIKGTIVAIDRIFITEEMRKRFRYLSHIPLTTEIQIVELKLQPPVVSKETLKAFQGEFEKRKKMRQRKMKAERARAKKYEVEQRKNNPYADYTFVASEQFKPPQSASDSLVSESSSLEDSMQTHTQDEQLGFSQSPESASISFAQVTKSRHKSIPQGSPSPKMAWGMSMSSSTPALHHKRPEEEEEEEGRPPSYADSMFQALSNVTFFSPATNDSASFPDGGSGGGSSGGKKKKKKEKKQQQLLFSTGMARKN